jgi:hypothetical protein
MNHKILQGIIIGKPDRLINYAGNILLKEQACPATWKHEANPAEVISVR